MTKQNQLTNERRLSLTATLLQIWQITFSNQSSNIRLTNNCALDSNDLCWSQSLVSTNDLFKITLAYTIVHHDWQMNDTKLNSWPKTHDCFK